MRQREDLSGVGDFGEHGVATGVERDDGGLLTAGAAVRGLSAGGEEEWRQTAPTDPRNQNRALAPMKAERPGVP